MSELPIQRLLLEAIGIIEGLHLSYAIIGGFAVPAWGVPRPTYDADIAVADIAVAADDEQLENLLAALERAGFTVLDEYLRGFQDVVAGMRKVKVTRLEARSVWEIDIFLARGAFLEETISRRRNLPLAGRPVSVLAPEDLILLKLIAHRRKDQLDVEEILRITPAVDVAYLRRWAAQLDVSDRLEQFLAERRS